MKSRPGGRAFPLALVLGLVRCAPAPRPTAPVPLPAVAPPVPTPAPSATAAPAPAPLPPFVDVREPRLDVALGTDRASVTLPAGDWLLRAGGSVERRRGPIVLSTPPVNASPLFAVQAGSFSTREAAERAREALARALGLEAAVVEVSGRFTLRAGTVSERKAAESLLSRVRRESSPDAFLVGAAPPNGAAPAPALLVSENGLVDERASPVEIRAVDGSFFTFGDASYRGNLVVRATGRGTVHVLDRVALEDYLKGVVPSEMGPKVYDELEALKAQAVAARSYALKRRGDFAAEGYDLCATPRCQVYGGATAEQPLSSQAVDETAGEVLLFGGRIADALFTSTCGGRTEAASNVFPSYRAADFPYLVPVGCSGEAAIELTSNVPNRSGPRAFSLLGVRGRALLASAGRTGTANADLRAARAALRDRLGLGPSPLPRGLLPAEVYADLADAAAFGDLFRLIENVELSAAPPGWPEKARAAYAVLLRFQLVSGAALPVDRPLRPEEAAGLWASVLLRLNDAEEVEGRLVASAEDGVVVKSVKGRTKLPLGEKVVLFRGGPDAWREESRLTLFAGDRVRLFVRGGAIHAVAAPPSPATGLYERESAWIHWTRQATGADLMARLRERDGSRPGRAVRRLEVLERGESGRASKVRVTTDQGTVLLAGLEIRFSLGLPESLFNFVPGRTIEGEPLFTFYGRGWGHGVGLCQNGAFGMALAGRGYREILARYYPGTGVAPDPASNGIR